LKRFRYSFDPLCLLASGCYAVNRWLIPVALKGAFLRGHFADVLLIPAALPPMLWVQRRVGLRTADEAPAWGEIFLHVVVWSLAAEVVAPHLFTRATGDVWDVVAYAGGALAAGLFWQRA
jgi:hypothetical protein